MMVVQIVSTTGRQILLMDNVCVMGHGRSQIVKENVHLAIELVVHPVKAQTTKNAMCVRTRMLSM